MIQGIYEELITKLVSQKIQEIDDKMFFIQKSPLDNEEAALFLSRHLSSSIKLALSLIKGENQIEKQIEVANKIISVLKEELKKEEFTGDLIETEGEILNAVFSKVDNYYKNFELRLHQITPYTRLTHSELFTGGNGGLTLESEIKKEILSSDRIDLLVSFIKHKGVVILRNELEEFTEKGGQLRIITTTYMGASDHGAIKMLSELKNTQIKISYNSGNERLHAKAYLFFRNTGFHTGYIGSSNFSRSALTDGLEWNLKITTKEVSHIIDKFQKTFDSYWQSDDFELFDATTDFEKLKTSLHKGKISKPGSISFNFFDLKPYPFQSEILEKLEVERNSHSRNRNLVVAATGTGKTMISAFDFKRYYLKDKKTKLLFLAHRMEILEQAKSTFCAVLKNNNFGEIWGNGLIPFSFEQVFASVQTVNNQIENPALPKDYYDFIVIDECHHLEAKSYRKIIEYFTPKVLLGLTATPERMDGGDIQKDFHGRIAAEIRLPQALDKKLLCPFQYFGITDSVDLSKVKWERGRYIASELSNLYTANDRRVREIITALDRYTNDLNEVCALGFCVTMEHAKFMAEKFCLAGLKADYLTSENRIYRDTLRIKLQNREINYLFVVDIFNEGVDIPEIDTVIFLRPTESLTIFLQQLGRGLRLAENKDCLTVLDFVGNARPEFSFERRFRALVGKTTTSISKEIRDDFPHLPLGCSIVLEKKAKEIILNNIKTATSLNEKQLIQKIESFENHSTSELTLKNFISFFNIPLQIIYKKGTWKGLCYKAGKLKIYDSPNENVLAKTVLRKWLSCNSLSYFRFILKLAKNSFNISLDDYSNEEQKMLLMLHYDFWSNEAAFDSLETSIKEIGKNRIITKEIIELLEILIDQIDFKEIEIDLPYEQPLKVHARYTREQILTAFGLNTFKTKSHNREGVANIPELKTELLFINLIKSEENFSPTTMYDDYAINEYLFHWQSQNSTSPDTSKGLSYINHKKEEKTILLFVREKAKDEFGNTLGYVFVGKGNLSEYYGEKPMNIKWKLEEPLPHYLWKDAAKLVAG
jgi:superfamily II DNA or RNA helicase